jgi:hypothetical protein
MGREEPHSIRTKSPVSQGPDRVIRTPEPGVEYGNLGTVHGNKVLRNMDKAIASRNQMRASLPKCPLCQRGHAYKQDIRGIGKISWPSTLLSNCPKFYCYSSGKRARAVRAHKACSICTSWTHQ